MYGLVWLVSGVDNKYKIGRRVMYKVNVYIRFENRDCSENNHYCPNQTFKLTYDGIKKMSIKKVYELISDDEIDKRDYNWDNEY